ncbi:hypothetical protein [Halodesulfovibrio sp. MK-HDV]|jgi:hypothetical protein|uniref:hypothetical protein n=1 Tax=Halodesulfovibrio sp. MK-HDV TaxID=2599925 RepID=UPI00136C4DA6|nr:hypothetical protein [Halodesulfovibrio sp. MK-HDV]KAF1076253.1 hypothetical protein MKHDV_01274 [Halodesulfovibrio sp. MK-HDV]
MPTQIHTEDILSHIVIEENAEKTLDQTLSNVEGCMTILNAGIGSIKLCYEVHGNSVTVSAKACTSVKDFSLGSATLSIGACETLSGKVKVLFAWAKGEVKVCFTKDFYLTYEAKLSASGAGSVSTSGKIHLI